MSRSKLAAATIGLLALVLTGCGAGQTANTSQDRPAVPGINLSDAGIAVRNAAVEPTAEGYPAGGNAPIHLVLVNDREDPVRLVRLSSADAQSVTLAQAVQVGAATAGTTPAAPGQADLQLVPGGLYSVTLQANGLREQLTSAGDIALELAFDDNTVFNLEVPVAPPLEPPARGEPIDTGH